MSLMFMEIKFYKYHGTGNDFILIDNRKGLFNLQNDQIALLCDRRFGIGADGLMLLSASKDFDFEMKYFNANGLEGTMCGNGGRCIIAFAKSLGIIDNQSKFRAIDGTHESKILSESGNETYISLKMKDVDNIKIYDDYFLINTGSPHYIKFVNDIEQIDIYNEGKRIRWDNKFQPEGTNVNFVELKEDHLIVRTYERGVENVTLSCGTGVTASALAASLIQKNSTGYFNIKTNGGNLTVRFIKKLEKFTDIWLEGAAVKIFEGVIEVK